MRTYHANEIGNVAVLGHSGCGKTSIVEAMAYRSGIINRTGSISEGNTLSDYSEEEIKRQSSVNLAVIPVEWNNCKINLVDVPVIFDFVGEFEAALIVCGLRCIVVTASAGNSRSWIQSMSRGKEKMNMS